MNWQDTVLTEKQINELYPKATIGDVYHSVNERHQKLIAQTQAEASYKAGQQAGRQEVVDFVDLIEPDKYEGQSFAQTVLFWGEWQDKLKDWGIS